LDEWEVRVHVGDLRMNKIDSLLWLWRVLWN